MYYLPYEMLTITWTPDDSGFTLILPWLTMEIEVEDKDREWIKDATHNLHSNPLSANVQRFIQDLKSYPVFYIKPRTLNDFEGKDLQPCPSLSIDYTTPQRLMNTIGLTLEPALSQDILPDWTWDRARILDKARIAGTDLYDPLSLVTYLICYRLEWESTSWSGQDGLGQILEKFLREDEQKFFKAIGWVSKQSWYVTMESCDAMRPAFETFPKGQDLINHFIMDEAGHYKFMEQVFADLELNKEDFAVAPATKWLLACHKRMAQFSPLAFSAMINLFEAAFYEGQDPISRVIKLSSKPHAARGYDLHYKINQEHRHCDMPVVLANRLAPQTRAHAELTLSIFELTLNFLDKAEMKLEQFIKAA